jgi:predicted enzyme related to lactoylglutathione lyase
MSKGRNVWYDLMTTDMEGAKRFYSEVIGWRTQQWQDADPNQPYSMWVAGDTPLGGVMPLADQARQMGAPPHWLAYTTVEDVDRTVTQATQLGGKVLAPAFDIPKVGRCAVLADPQGAVFAVYKPITESGADAAGDKIGHFSWAELNTTDWEAAWKFYGQLFGWNERSRMDMGPGGTYFMFDDPTGHTKGGMSSMAKQMNMPAHWLHYITVADMDATVARVKQHGGKVLNGPMPIPGDDVIAQCMDAQGAAFAIYAHAKK